MDYALYILIGYLSGSIMYGYLLPKLICHIDVRELSDDKNPGTANAFIHAGIPVGCMVILCELLKGMLPVYAAAKNVDITGSLFAAVLAAPVLGHAFPLFQKGKNGGKAIAVSFGVLLGLYPHSSPVLALIVLYIFFSVFVIIRPHLFRSVITFLLFSVFCLLAKELPVSIKLGCFLLSATVISKHFAVYKGEHFSFAFPWSKKSEEDSQPTL